MGYPAKDINILMGDLNAKIGKDNTGCEEIMGRHGLGEENDNGERLKELCAGHNMVIGGSVFPHKRIHKATWISPDHKTENQIDHMCVSKKFRRSMEDVRVYRGADVGSDHNLVMGKFKLKLKRIGGANGNQEKRIKYNTQFLASRDTQEKFKLALKNRLQPLSELIEEEQMGVQEHWTSIKELYNSACKEEIGTRERKHKEWISKESIEKIQQRKEKKTKLNTSKTRLAKRNAQEEYAQANKEVKQSLKADKHKFIEEIAEMAEQAAASGNLKGIYDATKKLC